MDDAKRQQSQLHATIPAVSSVLLAASLVVTQILGAAAGAPASSPSLSPLPVLRSYAELHGAPYDVRYDSRSLILGGHRVLLLSGSAHYVRSTPQMWPSIFRKMRDAGLNAVESYVFWNYHVRSLGADPDYTGRGNVTLFLELAAKHNLFVIWRIGPYVCGEWPGGGLPEWLRQVPGMKPRSATQPYENVSRDWMKAHIELVRPYFAQNGGPIVLLQVENELSGPSNTPYVAWLGQLVTELDAGLPWTMCHGAHANDTIETCNGCDCPGDVPALQQLDQPAMWTENEQWFDRFGQGATVRSSSDVAYGVANFVATGGSVHNYYMFHGGTMWGNWSSTVRRTRLTPSYANSANLASDSIVYDPKYTHLAALHNILSNYADAILGESLPIAPTSINGSLRQIKFALAVPPLTFIFNDDAKKNMSALGPDGLRYHMSPKSVRIFGGGNVSNGEVSMVYYSHLDQIDGEGQPYLHALADEPLAFESWNDTGSDKGTGTWHRASFALPSSLPDDAQISVNMTGFGQGNLFLNGVHIAFFSLQDGGCDEPPGGVNSHGSCLGYVASRCGRPTQDCYHVPPEWVRRNGVENTILVWSDVKMPPNVSHVDTDLARVVYRVDPETRTAQQHKPPH